MDTINDDIRDDETDAPSAAMSWPAAPTETPRETTAPSAPESLRMLEPPHVTAARARYAEQMKAGSEYMRPMSRNWEAVSDQVLRDRRTLDEWDRATKHGDRRAGPFLLPTPPPVLWKQVDTAPPAKPLELEPLHDGSTWDPGMIARAAEHVGPDGTGGLFVLLNVMARETFLGVTRFDGEDGRARMLQELSRDPADTLEKAQAYLSRLPPDLAQQIGRFKRSPEVIRLLAGEERRRSGGWFARTGSGP